MTTNSLTAAAQAAASASARPPRRRQHYSPREILLGVLFCVPAVAGLGTFVIFPLFQAIFLSTRGTDINGNPSRSVGMDNFAQLFTPEFGEVLMHTLVFTLFVVVVGVVGPLALAVPLAQRLPGMRVFRTLFTLPFAYSASAASVVWLLMLDPSMSPVNWALRVIGITAPEWTVQSPWALITVAWATVWVVAGFNLLVIGAGLAGVDEDVLEAARIDGASGPRTFFSVVLPMISPSLFFVIVTTTLTSLQALGQVQVMTDGGPNGATRTLVFSIFNNAFENGNNEYGLASAQGLVLLIVGIVLAVIQFGVIERRVHYR
ncbi:carbohydrate ABC transporter permease [Labedaea rhizosphaerae]|uniref:Carbohydrate ABC transporter membrane protein 1 (CUT1 family) n=1 Tax=Labedaea rhizosphaerae TaxID=598644 RepID=A0A4R6SL02_LABRH|nr:sugar ABC transporter permease [Labedaea rhizosphaerae]TDQ04240.1 carbohydrate ABC transporter membrane protein 1 (CUT1 family) [Labedaea rhizosphaerae]